jgi:hypothetical protein
MRDIDPQVLPKSQRDILNIQRRLQVNEKMYLFLLEKRASTVIAQGGYRTPDEGDRERVGLGVVRPDKMKILLHLHRWGACC